MKLNPYLKDFIEEHIDLIEDGKYADLYDAAEEELTAFCHLVPHWLYVVGINLMEYIGNRVPEGFMTDSDLESIYVPDNIRVIGGSAFSFTDKLNILSVPKKCEFEKEILFDSALRVLDYRGTVDELHHYTNLLWYGEATDWWEGSVVTQIRCTDGVIDLYEQ